KISALVTAMSDGDSCLGAETPSCSCATLSAIVASASRAVLTISHSFISRALSIATAPAAPRAPQSPGSRPPAWRILRLAARAASRMSLSIIGSKPNAQQPGHVRTGDRAPHASLKLEKNTKSARIRVWPHRHARPRHDDIRLTPISKSYGCRARAHVRHLTD